MLVVEVPRGIPGLVTAVLAVACLASCATLGSRGPAVSRPLERIQLSDDGTRFVGAESGRRFLAWGFNYDRDEAGRLLEDYWHDDWHAVVEDFQEMKELGANVVRVHLQTGKFMVSPEETNTESLDRLAALVQLAEDTGLYLNITGLGCYHKQDVPPWYDELDEQARWAVQARFWEAVSAACAHSPAVFCYDLMNEPIIGGGDPGEREWLGDDFAGKHFVQRITLDLAGRTRHDVARAWVDTLVPAIRRNDERAMVTVGVIPWAMVWPNAKPLFYSEEVGENLDFASVHFYPERGEIDKALEALAVYDVGKPLVVEEMFPMKCSPTELMEFVEGSRPIADGWISFYWGTTIEEYEERDDIGSAITRVWLRLFRDKAPEITGRHGNPADKADAS